VGRQQISRSLSGAAERPDPLDFLITGDFTGVIPGVIRAGEAALAESLGWSVPAFRKAFEEIFAQGMAVPDWSARLVFLPKAVNHNPPASPNVVKRWFRAFEELPECALKERIGRNLKAFLDDYGEAYAKEFPKAFPEASAEPIREPMPESGSGSECRSQEAGIEAVVPLAPRRKLKTEWPADFVFDEAVRKIAEELHVADPQREFDRFKNRSISKGETFRDWMRAWRNWCDSDFCKKATAANGTVNHGTGVELASQFLEKVREQGAPR
jgi:hypothetical protein